MTPFHRIHWRISIAFATLLVVLAAGTIVLMVVVVPPRFDAQERDVAKEVLGIVGVAAGVAVALAVIFGFILARRATRSLRMVVQGAQNIASGDLDHRVRTLSADETVYLADALNRIGESLKRVGSGYAEEHGTMSAVLATMSDGVAVIDSDGKIALSNPAAHDLLGLEVTERDGHRFVELVRDHELNRLLADCRNSQENRYAEVELTGSRRYLGAIATPLHVRSEQPPDVLLVVHDLTQAQRVETTRREFVANVSHELRTPLASIRAAAESLEGGALEERPLALQFMGHILREVDRMSLLVEELLELSRLQTGQAALNIGSVDISVPITQAVDQSRPRANAAGIDMALNCPMSPVSVLGDHDKLRQLVGNLLENGIKFTPTGGSITIAVEPGEDEVAVIVSDTGTGISEEHLPHVFERFYKADKSRGDGGTGLGLAIANHVVLAHNGRIWVESREGEGSRFTFTVPVDKPK